MLICDICNDEIKRNGIVFRIPKEYAIPEINDICSQCNQKINVASDKIDRDSTKTRRIEKRTMIQALLKDNNDRN